MVIFSFKKMLINVLLALFSIGFTLFLAEMLLMVFCPQPLYTYEKGLFVASDDYGYCLQANVEKRHSQPEFSYIIKTNAYGFRGNQPNFKAKWRVLVLGDSEGMGEGLKEEQGLCRLSQFFFDQQNIDLDIFNTSVSGYTTINQLQVLKKWITNYRPNLVLLLFNWNDLGVTSSYIAQDGCLMPGKGMVKPGLSQPAIREWLNRHSQLYCLIKRFYYSRILQDVVAEDKLLSEADFKNTVSQILQMKRICDVYGTGFIAVIPPELRLAITLTGNQSQSPRDILTNRLQADSIPFKECLAQISPAEKESLRFKANGHWNARAHLYFSDCLNRLIIEAIPGLSDN